MSEGKNTPAEGKSSKKSAGQKSPAKKPQKEKSMPEEQIKPPVSVGASSSLVTRINEIGEEIENTPLKSFEKREREKIIQSYERLIFTMVREINNSRQ